MPIDKTELLIQVEEQFIDMPYKAQWLVDLDGMPRQLLSFSGSVGEPDHFKIWIQGEAAIKEQDIINGGGYNQLTFKGNFVSDSEIDLIERAGYPGIKEGEELDFLMLLLSDGNWEPWSLV